MNYRKILLVCLFSYIAAVPFAAGAFTILSFLLFAIFGFSGAPIALTLVVELTLVLCITLGSLLLQNHFLPTGDTGFGKT